MNGIHHALIWIDHREAKVRCRDDEETPIDTHSATLLQRLHHRATGWEAGAKPPDDTEFYQRILGALDPTGAILITGPNEVSWINETVSIDLTRQAIKNAPIYDSAAHLDRDYESVVYKRDGRAGYWTENAKHSIAHSVHAERPNWGIRGS